MRTSKSYFQSQWSKMESAVSKLISDKPGGSAARKIELEPDCFARSAELAERHGVTVDAIVNHAMELYLAGEPNGLEAHAAHKRRENNPLLQLDALLSGRSRASHGERYDEHDR